MAAILPLPARRPDRGAPDPAAGPGRVHAFPLISHLKVVEAIGAEMRNKGGDDDAAEQVLIQHLEIECGRLARLGIDDAEIEHVCGSFAVKAWMAAVFTDCSGEDVA
jgi:hypothetical protein